MKRTYAAKRLLEHGPLTRGQFLEITGWPEQTADSTLRNLLASKVAVRAAGRNHRGLEYQLARGARA